MTYNRLVRVLAGKELDWPPVAEGRLWWVVEGVSLTLHRPRRSYQRLRPLLRHRHIPGSVRITILTLEGLVFPEIDEGIRLEVQPVASPGKNHLVKAFWIDFNDEIVAHIWDDVGIVMETVELALLVAVRDQVRLNIISNNLNNFRPATAAPTTYRVAAITAATANSLLPNR